MCLEGFISRGLTLLGSANGYPPSAVLFEKVMSQVSDDGDLVMEIEMHTSLVIGSLILTFIY
jgi:hypothetical protein